MFSNMRAAICTSIVAIAWAAASGGSAQAAITAVDFETPALTSGTTVGSDSGPTTYAGLNFLNVAGTQRPHVLQNATIARSPSRMLDISYVPPTTDFPVAAFNAQLTAGKASSFTVYARAQVATGGVGMRLRAFDNANGVVDSEPASGFKTVTKNGWTEFTVTASSGFPISRVAMDMDPNANEVIYIDDVSYIRDDAPATGDFSLSLASGADTVTALTGQTTQIPITVNRLDGSNGNVTMSLQSALPPGVTSQGFSPNPVPATQTSTMLTLSTDNAAPLSAPTPLIIRGTPASAAVADGPRDVIPAPSIQVSDPFSLGQGSSESFDLRPCESKTYSLAITRGAGFTDDIDLSVPAMDGTEATLSKTTLSGPGPHLVDVSLRRVDARGTGAIDGEVSRTFKLIAQSGSISKTLINTTLFYDPPVEVAPSLLLIEPTFGHIGGSVAVRGRGLCPGSKLRIRNTGEVFDTTYAQDLDAQTLTGTTPAGRVQTDSPIEVLQPGEDAQNIVTRASVHTQSYRADKGFGFHNERPTTLGLEGWAELLGKDEVFLPFWTELGIDVPNPLFLALHMSWAEFAMQAATGSCTGYSLGSLKLLSDPARYINEVFSSSIPGRKALSLYSNTTAIRSQAYDDHRFIPLRNWLFIHQGTIFTTNFWSQWFHQQGDIAPLPLSDALPESIRLGRAHHAVAAFKARLLRLMGSKSQAMLYLGPDNSSDAHMTNAYDAETLPNGDFVVHVYDSNVEWLPGEQTDHDAHSTSMARSMLTLHPDGNWTYRGTHAADNPWRGRLGIDGRLMSFAAFNSTVPIAPGFNDSVDGLAGNLDSLGSISGLVGTVFELGTSLLPGSTGTRVEQGTPGPFFQFVPPDNNPNAPFMVGGPSNLEMKLNSTANGQGKLKATVFGKGGTSLVEATTAPAGKLDLKSPKDKLGVSLVAKSKLKSALITSGEQTVDGGRLAQIGGKNLKNPLLEYGKGGKRLKIKGVGKIKLLLSSTKGGNSDTFASEPFPVKQGESVVVVPPWQGLSRGTISVTVTSAGGASHTVKLRNTVKKPTLKISKVTAKRDGTNAVVKVTARVGGKLSSASLGIGVQVRQGSKVLDKGGKTASVRRTGQSTTTITVPLSAAAQGAKGLKVRVSGAVYSGKTAVTVTKASRTATLK